MSTTVLVVVALAIVMAVGIACYWSEKGDETWVEDLSEDVEFDE